MRRVRILLGCFVLTLAFGSFTGCGNAHETVGSTATVTAPVSMESTPILDYKVPQTYPNVLINIKGYSVKGDKAAVIKGKELPLEFRLVDADTQEVVYSGMPDKITFNEELGLYTGRAVFSEYAKEGTFYVECDKIGRSLTFAIEKEHYQQQFEQIYEAVIKSCQEQEAENSDVMQLLTAYEWYPEVFPDEDANKIPDIMEEVAEWFKENEKQEADLQSESLYVAVLAKFSYLYQNYDAQYAAECLQKASALVKDMPIPEGRNADYFHLLTEMYRTTGQTTYKNRILEYASFFEENSSYLEEPSYLYGAMTYLVTRRRVDIKLCNTLMSDIMGKGEEVSNSYHDMINPIMPSDKSVSYLLARAQELFCCNFVLNNYEYTHSIEELLNFLMGCNKEALCFYPEEGNKSSYLLLLTQMTAIENSIEEKTVEK